MSRIDDKAASEWVAGKTVFLDKDDTVLCDVPYSVRVDGIEWAVGALESMRRLEDAGYSLALVTNQSGVARGDFTEHQVREYLREVIRQAAREGVRLSAALYCPHHPDGIIERFSRSCACRKPNPGMLAYAAGLLGADLEHSWMVGDLLDDVEAGRLAGCRTVLLSVHEDQVPAEDGPRSPDFVVPTLALAAEKILALSETV